MTDLTRHICALTPLPDHITDQIELIPVGSFRLADKRGRLTMRLEHAAEVISASLAAAPGKVLPIDFDHRSLASQGTADSRAAGWITALKAEGNRIVASVEWTQAGRQALEDRAYRFVSPVFKTRPDGRVVRIEGAGLVNNPALPELRQIASIASKENQMEPIEQIAEQLGLSADKPEEIGERISALLDTETQMASIAEAAGEDGESDGAATRICARLAAPAPAADPAEYVPLATFTDLQTQFASLQEEVKSGQVEGALQRARDAGKLTPAMESWAETYAANDLAGFEAWAASTAQVVNVTTLRHAGRPAPVKTDALDETERQVASMMGVSDESFLATRNAAQKGA